MRRLIILFLFIVASVNAYPFQSSSEKTWHNLAVSRSIPSEKLLININRADIKLLKTLKGIGTQKAKAIIKYRDTHHGFDKIEDLKLIKGINAKIFYKIKKKITL